MFTLTRFTRIITLMILLAFSILSLSASESKSKGEPFKGSTSDISNVELNHENTFWQNVSTLWTVDKPSDTPHGMFDFSPTWTENEVSNFFSTIHAPSTADCDGDSFAWDGNIVINGTSVSSDVWFKGGSYLYLIPPASYPDAFDGQVTISIPEAVSWDGYLGRQNTNAQRKEKWRVIFVKNGQVVKKSDYTDDLTDNVISAEWSGELMEEVTFPNGVDEIYISHYEDGTYGTGSASSANSVRPSSICFDYTACDNVTNGGSIGPEQSGCGVSFDPEVIESISMPSGGSGGLEFLWLKSTTTCNPPNGNNDSEWDVIVGANGSSYDPPAISETTCYLRCSRRSGCDDYDGEANIVTVEVYNDVPNVSLTEVETQCSNGESFQLEGHPSGGSFSGDGVSSSGLFNPASAGIGNTTISYSYSDENGCSESDEIVIEVIACEEPANIDIFNDCGSDLSFESTIKGLLDGASNCMSITNSGSVTRVIAEVWVERGDCNNNTFPAFVTLSFDGQEFNVPGISVIQSANSGVPETLYRYEFVGSASQVCLVDGNGCDATSLALYIERNDPNASSSLMAFNQELEGGSSSTDDCIMSTLQIGNSDLPRDIKIDVPIHEKDNRREVTVSVEIKDGSGNIIATDSETFTTQNAGVEAAIYSLMLDNVSGDGINAEVTVCSPANTGDSFGIGAVSTTSNEGCVVCELAGSVSDDEICAGDIATLTANYTSNNGGVSYEWSNGETTASIDVSPTTTTNYSLTITDSKGCTVEDEGTVLVNGLPGVSIDPVNALCANEGSIQLVGNPSGGSFSGDAVNDDGIFDPAQAGAGVSTVTYTYEDENSCSSSATIDIEVNEVPSVAAVADQNPVCAGESVTLTAEASGGSGDYQYQWSDNLGDGSEVTLTNVTVDATYSVTITDTEGCSASTTVDVSVEEKASVGDFVFVDMNANGVQDAEDTGIQGVLVTLFNAAGDIVDVTSSGSQGEYSFDVCAGEYLIVFGDVDDFNRSPQGIGSGATDSDANASNGQTANFTLAPGDDNVDIDAGYFAPASIGDFVFADTNADGIQGEGEEGIDGITVNLKDENGVVVASTTTMNGGMYEFSGLTPGDYSIQFILPDGSIFSPLNASGNEATDSDADPAMDGMTEVVTLSSGENNEDIDAGIISLASIGDFVFEDLNADGIQDVGEEGIDGITVNLKNENGVVVASTTTMNGGMYEFTELAPGDYSIQFVLPDGSLFSPLNASGDEATDSDADPAMDGMTATVTLVAGDNNEDVDAGIYELASIGDFVFSDTNGNGVQDAGESGIDEIIVNLKDENGVIIASTFTMNGGMYEFTGLTPGVYSIQFEIPDESTFSPLNAGSDEATDSDADPAMNGMTANVTLTSGENNEDIDAGMYEPASIGDLVFEDLDADGIQDAGEEGIDGITVNLKDENGVVVETTTTMNGGMYLFSGLTPGDYSIQFVLPDGSVFSPLNASGDEATDSDADPNMDGMTAVVTLTSGDDIDNIDAGIYEDGSIGDLVFIDTDGDGVQDAGEEGIDGITVNLKNADGNVIAITTTMNGGLYEFAGLAPGNYSVQFVLPDGSVFSPLNASGDESTDSDADPAMNGMTEVITLESGETYDDLDAGIFEPASVGDFVFDDTNNDGVQDTNDEPLSGVVVNLTNEAGEEVNDINGDPVGQVVTDDEGFYEFTNLVPGDYIVVFTQPDNYEVTQQDANGAVGDENDNNTDSDINEDGESYVVTLSSGEMEADVDAGFSSIADLSLIKSVSTSTPLIGEAVTFTIEVSNAGPNNATGVDVSDILPNGYSNIDNISNDGENNEGVITWSDLSISTQSSIVLTFDATVLAPGDGIDYVNVAQVDAVDQFDPDSEPGNPADSSPGNGIGSEDDDGTQDDNDEDDGDDAEVSPLSASIDIEKYTNGEDADEAPGPFVFFQNVGTEQVTWTYEVTNTGTTDLQNVRVFDDVEGQVGTIPMLAVGETQVLTFMGAAVEGQYMNLATAVGQPVDENGNEIGEEVLADDPSHYFGFNFNIDLEPENLSYCPGELVPYTITVRQNSTPPAGFNVEFRDIIVTQPFAPMTLMVADVPGQFDISQDADGDGALDSDEGEFQWTLSTVVNSSVDDIVTDMFTIVVINPQGTVVSSLVETGIDEFIFNVDDSSCASLGNLVWFDENADGIQDIGEDGVNGITVNLYEADQNGNPTGGPIATTTTDVGPGGSDGYYQFTGLVPDDYIVEFVDPDGNYIFSPQDNSGDETSDSDADETSGQTSVITLMQGDSNQDVDAGVFLPAQIGNLVWDDEDGDGLYDPATEDGLQFVTVALTDQNGNDVNDIDGNPVGEITTDAQGMYMFTNLLPGMYIVEFTTPGDYIPTVANTGGGDTDGTDIDSDSDADPVSGESHVIDLTAGETDDEIDAGFFVPASLGDFVWFDANSNGLQDESLTDSGVNGIPVTLYADANSDGTPDNLSDPLQTSTTMDDPAGSPGFYEFTGLPAGDYVVAFDLTGYVSSPADVGGNNTIDSDVDPATGYSSSINLLPGANDPSIDAGIYVGGSIGDLVWEDISSGTPNVYDAGTDVVLAGVTVMLLQEDENGDFVMYGDAQETTALGYFFGDLPAGNYQVKFTAPGGYSFVEANEGGDDALDSDVDPNTGLSPIITLGAGEDNPTIDAGLLLPPLPVELVSFTGRWDEVSDVNQLEWATSSEINNDYFEIERSLGSSANFAVIARVDGMGTTFETQNYDMVDRNIDEDGIYFYRLKQIDFDGSFAYSDIIAIRVERSTSTDINVYPNPSQDYVNVQIDTEKQEDIIVRLFDMSGKLILTKTVRAKDVEGRNNIRIDVQGLPSGLYNMMTILGNDTFAKQVEVID